MSGSAIMGIWWVELERESYMGSHKAIYSIEGARESEAFAPNMATNVNIAS